VSYIISRILDLSHVCAQDTCEELWCHSSVNHCVSTSMPALDGTHCSIRGHRTSKSDGVSCLHFFLTL